MSKPELTKQLIATTLKSLARKKPLDRISISEIVDTVSINRQTFYYHFADKQELVCWIFDTDINSLSSKNQNDSLVDEVSEYIYSEMDFYKDALTSECQNNLRDHIYATMFRRLIDEILAILGNRKMSEDVINLYARFFSSAAEGELVRWARGGMKESKQHYIWRYAPMLKDMLVHAVDMQAGKEPYLKQESLYMSRTVDKPRFIHQG